MLNQNQILDFMKNAKAVFFKELYTGGDAPFINQVSTRIKSNKAVEVYGWLEKISGMKEFVGEAKISKISASSYSITNVAYEDTIEVNVLDFIRDSLGQYPALFQAAAEEARQHDSEKIAELLVNGFSNKCYDGKNFFATNHKYSSGNVSYSNMITAKLSSTSFRLARKMLRTMVRPNGKTMRLGKNLILIVSAANEGVAREILEAERNENGATNVDRGAAKVEVFSDIDTMNADAWFLVESGSSMKPFIIQEEIPVTLRNTFSHNAESVVKNNTFYVQPFKSSGYGYAFPQLVVGSDGSATS